MYINLYCITITQSYADLESSPEPNEDPVSTEDPIPMDADDQDDEQAEVEPPTAAEIVQAGLQRGDLSDENISVDRREIDEVEEQLVQQHVRDGCNCDYGPRKSPCCKSISVERYRSIRNDMAELTHDELDLVVMAQVMAGCSTADSSLSQNRQRTQTHTTFHHNGDRICQKTFLFLHAMGYWRFKAIKAGYLSNGLCSRRHGNKGRSLKTGLSLKEIEEVVQFIMNYAGKCTHIVQR